MPHDDPQLLPATVAAEIVQSVTDRDSALMTLCRKIAMPSRSESVPVVSSAPAAGFVDPVTGLKPTGVIDWSPVTLTASEIGVVVALPDDFVADTNFAPWPSAREEIIRSFVKTFELAALYGRPTDQPGWPAGGLTAAAAAAPVLDPDALGALDAAMSLLEADGISPSGILGGAALRAALRAQTVAVMQPFSPAPASIYGVPVVFSGHWDDSVGLALVGGFENVLAGIRQDLTWLMTSVGVLTDATGKVVVNAFTQDQTLMRCYWRIALQITQPLGPADTPVKTLALAKVGTPVGEAAEAKSTTAKK